LLSGAWNEAGIQATELLNAVCRVSLGIRISKEAEVGLTPEEPPVRTVVLLLYRLLVKRDRGTDHITVLSVESTDAIRPAPWCADRMSTLVGVGLLEAATA
jgi:hypothetical protein